MHIGPFAKKAMDKYQDNTFFKQQVIPEPQMLLHISRA